MHLHFVHCEISEVKYWNISKKCNKARIFLLVDLQEKIFRFGVGGGERKPLKMKKGYKRCLLDTPRTVRVSEKTWQVIVQTSRT